MTHWLETGLWSAGGEALRPAGTGGWIGYWSPGIGDPTVVGWITVVLYFAAACACWWIARTKRDELTAAEHFVWRTLAVGLAALGVNKQLDLQSALTELGRILANDEGWYNYRHRVQRVFILGVGATAVVIGVGLLIVLRRSSAATRLTMLGACTLLAFVVIRASSFHHVDVFISSTWWGIRGNWLVEVGGLLVILVGAGLRSRTSRPRANAELGASS
jgi:NADH:ubiquinone oxidoreductase subunit K